MSCDTQRPSYAVRNGKLASIHIGPKNTIYRVHERLLIEYSKYFAGAFRGTWWDAQESVLCLRDVDCDTFDIFINWLYTQRLPEKATDWASFENLLDGEIEPYEQDIITTGEDFRSEVQLQQVKAYIFGDQFLSEEFKAAVFKTCVDDMCVPDTLPYYQGITCAFANLQTEDPLLQLLVDAHCHRFCTGDDSPMEIEEREQLPHDFLIRVMLKYSSLVAKHDRLPLDATNYHLTADLEKDKGSYSRTEPSQNMDEDLHWAMYTHMDTYMDEDIYRALFVETDGVLYEDTDGEMEEDNEEE